MQQGLDVTANNVANISTVGYKAVESSFAELMKTNLQAPEGNSPLTVGQGAKMEATSTVFAAGAPERTDRALDFALTDANTFFAVQSAEGTRYTRSGSFHLSQEGASFFLTASDGGYVLDGGGNRIIVDSDTEKINNIGVFTFLNMDALERQGSTSFIPTQGSGAAQATDGAYTSGYLEGSSVNLADEMTAIIKWQRSFQMNAKMVQISDEIMQTINGLR